MTMIKEYDPMDIDKGIRKYLASKRPINMSRSKQVHLLMKDFYSTGKEHTLDYQHLSQKENMYTSQYTQSGSRRFIESQRSQANPSPKPPNENAYLATCLQQVIPVRETELSQNKKWLKSKKHSKSNLLRTQHLEDAAGAVGGSIGWSKSIDEGIRNAEQVIDDKKYHQDIDIASHRKSSKSKQVETWKDSYGVLKPKYQIKLGPRGMKQGGTTSQMNLRSDSLEQGVISELSQQDNQSILSTVTRQLPQLKSQSVLGPEIPTINPITGSVIAKQPVNVLGTTDTSKYLEHMARHQSMKNHKLSNRQYIDHQNYLLNAQSGLVAPKKDFYNPVKDQTTFGYSPDKCNKKVFDRAYITEFRGKGSPPATRYQSDLDTFKFAKFDSKTLTRDPRVCPIVSKGQLK